MTQVRNRERGEGKIGCMVTLLVFLVGAGIAYKLLPPYMAQNDLLSAAKDVAAEGGVKDEAQLLATLRKRALDLNIPEATEPGAITVSKSGTRLEGSVTIKISYKRKIDLYGVTTVNLDFDRVTTQYFVDVR